MTVMTDRITRGMCAIAAGWVLGAGLCGCGGSGPDQADQALPGTMRVLSVTRVTADPEDPNLIYNGDFNEFWAGAPAPTGFNAPADSASRARRDAGLADAPGSSFAVVQTWDKPDADMGLPYRLHARVSGLKAETVYNIEAIARAAPGVLAGIGVFSFDEAGHEKQLCPVAVRVPGGLPAGRYAGRIATDAAGDVALAAVLISASALPANVTWYSWKLTEAQEGPDAATVRMAMREDADRRKQVDAVLQQLRKDAEARGGCAAWTEGLASFRANLKETLSLIRDSGAEAFLGEDSYLFRPQTLSYLLDDELVYAEPDVFSPAMRAIVAFDNTLRERGIDLIFLAVPGRGEIYPDKLVPGVSSESAVSPQISRFLQCLAETGVETVDLATDWRAGRKGGDAIYFRTEARPSNTAVARAARVLMKRMDRYAFLHAEGAVHPAYVETKKTSAWTGSLLESLPQDKRKDFVDEMQTVYNVTDPDGKPFTAAEDSPILVAGEFAHLYEEESASLAAQLSSCISFTVGTAPIRDAGPQVPAMLAELGADYLKNRRVFIWCVAAELLGPAEAACWGGSENAAVAGEAGPDKSAPDEAK